MRIDFYILKNSKNFNEISMLACRILMKAYNQQQSVFVLCEDESQAKKFNALLWTFKDISFVPHILADNMEVTAPIIVGWSLEQAKTENILLNLSPYPINENSFKRIIEFVIKIEPWHNQSKMKYKTYKELSYTINTHEI